MSRKTKITTLFVAVATAAVFTSSASGMARMDNGAYGNGGVAGEAAVDTSNIPYLSHGFGITREAPQASQGFGITRIAPAVAERSVEIPYLSHGVGITREVPQATQGLPVYRDTADGATLQRGYTAEVSLASSSSSVDWSEVATGFGFGLLLAALGAASLLMLRQRTLRTH
jgi:hypothetical protein